MKPWQAYEAYEDYLPNHVLLNRVADAAGVSTRSISRVAKKRLAQEGKRDRKRLKGCPYTFVSVSLWDDYMQIGHVERVAQKPKGWLTSKALHDQGFSRRKLYELVQDGTLEAVYVRNTLYFEPRRAEQCLQDRQNLRPPPGWVGIAEVTQQAQRSRQALWTYIKTHDITTQPFLHPERDQLVRYMPVEAAQTYLATVTQTSKHIPKIFAKQQEAVVNSQACTQTDISSTVNGVTLEENDTVLSNTALSNTVLDETASTLDVVCTNNTVDEQTASQEHPPRENNTTESESYTSEQITPEVVGTFEKHDATRELTAPVSNLESDTFDASALHSPALANPCRTHFSRGGSYAF
jgi:hypothetical protein